MNKKSTFRRNANNYLTHTKKEKGITLIALVVTIIVLLILAGISIAMLTGEGGILTNAREANDKTGRANAIEMAQLDILDVKANNEGKITDGEFKEILNRYFTDKEGNAITELEENLSELELKTLDGKYSGILASEIYNGTFSGSTPTKAKLAKEVLKVNPDAGADAPDYEKSPYVNYNGRTCRVLYNDDEHGLQIVTENSVENVVLGSSNFATAISMYNGLVNNLNGKAKEYMSSDGIATDARCLGSIPTPRGEWFQGETTEEYYKNNDYSYFSKYNDQFKISDKNYEEDFGQIEKLNLKVGSYPSFVWLASRGEGSANGTAVTFTVRYTNKDYRYGTREDVICAVLGIDSPMGYDRSHGFMPVFLLSLDAKIKGNGDGRSADTAYELTI